MKYILIASIFSLCGTLSFASGAALPDIISEIEQNYSRADMNSGTAITNAVLINSHQKKTKSCVNEFGQEVEVSSSVSARNILKNLGTFLGLRSGDAVVYVHRDLAQPVLKIITGEYLGTWTLLTIKTDAEFKNVTGIMVNSFRGHSVVENIGNLIHPNFKEKNVQTKILTSICQFE